MSAMEMALQIAGVLGAPAILSGAVIAWLSRRMRRIDHREDCRSSETVMVLKGLLTIGGLAGATAQALKDGQANGAVTQALEDYGQYSESLSAYLVERAADRGN